MAPDLRIAAVALVDDLAGSGLDVEVAQEITAPVETDDGERHAIDLLVRASRPGPTTPGAGVDRQ